MNSEPSGSTDTSAVERGPATSRLSAIVLVDAVGSTAAMSNNEMAAMQAIERSLDTFVEVVGATHGEVLNYAGDCALAVFDSVANAVAAALKFQEVLLQNASGDGLSIGFRAGVHLGEVYQSGSRVFGDAINLTERIQSVTPVGGVAASDLIYRSIQGRSDFSFEYLGPHRGRNMAEPIGLYRVHKGTVGMLKATPRALPLPSASDIAPEPGGQSDVPSIAVLPFRNLSGDPNQDYFADGVTDDIITSLSHFRTLDLIARASSFAMRNQNLPVSEIGRRLGARYLAQGSIRCTSNRVRVSIELSNTENEHTVWAEKYDRPLEDIFALQDEIAELAVSVMSARIEEAERRRVASARPETLHAYGLALRAQNHLLSLTPNDNAAAREFYERSILESPRYARAYAGLSRVSSLEWRHSWSPDSESKLERAFDIAVQAVRADPNDARGHAELGFAMLYRKEHERSLASYRRALSLNPNDATIIAEMADALSHSGHPGEALEHFKRAMRLNPFYPDQYLWDMAGAYMKLHEYEDAIKSVLKMNNVQQGRRILAACYAHLGRLEDARREADMVRAAQPDFDAERWGKIIPDTPEVIDHFVQGLKKAGL
ncbi:adenylate/guanylate cyclase domain-containing protein [Mesorhizobium xinjiangense]|uniref:adenylate/guanylate cyclase domain-containing protein n=1 Tax=Mesorhizobium xinjiangense TaxID=2678685 RepID=UPI0012EE76DC|nr:adenylate/guanylate cyclase domain-containing protein [Mesorhizobium xinjiangense]